MPVSTRIVRPALRISHGVMLTDSSSASVSRSRYGSSDAPAASGKKSVSLGRSHVSCSATSSTLPTDARCTLLIATLLRPSSGRPREPSRSPLSRRYLPRLIITASSPTVSDGGLMPQHAITQPGLDADQPRRQTPVTAALVQIERRMYAAVALSTAITIGALGLIIALT